MPPLLTLPARLSSPPPFLPQDAILGHSAVICDLLSLLWLYAKFHGQEATLFWLALRRYIDMSYLILTRREAHLLIISRLLAIYYFQSQACLGISSRQFDAPRRLMREAGFSEPPLMTRVPLFATYFTSQLYAAIITPRQLPFRALSLIYHDAAISCWKLPAET